MRRRQSEVGGRSRDVQIGKFSVRGFRPKMRDRVSSSALRSASSTDVVVPATRRSSLGDRAFPVAGARAWNAPPASVTAAPSLSSFRRLLETFLFQRQRRQ